MKLVDLFDEGIGQADYLVQLHDFLDNLVQPQLREGGRKKFYNSKITNWPKKSGLVRLLGDDVIIFGTKDGLSDLVSDRKIYKDLLLRSAYVLAMAAFDKALHEAVLKNFSKLASSGAIDEFANLPISTAYAIAISARKRTGKGGSKKRRPGNDLKRMVSAVLYRSSFLSTRSLGQVAGAFGIKSFWKTWGDSLTPKRNGKEAQAVWGKLYQRRNQIAHEIDIIRMLKGRSVAFHQVSAVDVSRDLTCIKVLAHFILKKIEK